MRQVSKEEFYKFVTPNHNRVRAPITVAIDGVVELRYRADKQKLCAVARYENSNITYWLV